MVSGEDILRPEDGRGLRTALLCEGTAEEAGQDKRGCALINKAKPLVHPDRARFSARPFHRALFGDAATQSSVVFRRCRGLAWGLTQPKRAAVSAIRIDWPHEHRQVRSAVGGPHLPLGPGDGQRAGVASHAPFWSVCGSRNARCHAALDVSSDRTSRISQQQPGVIGCAMNRAGVVTESRRDGRCEFSVYPSSMLRLYAFGCSVAQPLC